MPKIGRASCRDRIVSFGIPEFGDDVAVTQNQAVGGRSLRGESAQHFTKGAHLVFLEIPFRAVSFGPRNRFLQFCGVHARLRGRFVLPRSGTGEIGTMFRGRSLRAKAGNQECRQ